MRGVLTPQPPCLHPTAMFVIEAQILAMGCESASCLGTQFYVAGIRTVYFFAPWLDDFHIRTWPVLLVDTPDVRIRVPRRCAI